MPCTTESLAKYAICPVDPDLCGRADLKIEDLDYIDVQFSSMSEFCIYTINTTGWEISFKQGSENIQAEIYKKLPRKTYRLILELDGSQTV